MAHEADDARSWLGRFSPRWPMWAMWFVVAAICGLGLRRYRVSNSMDAWMPDLAVSGPYQSYLVIGFPGDRIDPNQVAGRLRLLPIVAFCIDPVSVRLTEAITGLTPEDFVTGKDGIYCGVFCFRAAGVSDEQFVSGVGDSLALIAPRERFAVGGPAAFTVAMNRWSEDRLPRILTTILIVGGAMLWRVTGSATLAAASMTAITLSQVIFLGFISWLRIPVDMAIVLVPPMMMGLGFSYAAHRVLRRRSLAILAICAIAAGVGIASFATADLLPVRHFALSGVPALAIVWLVIVTTIQPDSTARRRRVNWLRAPRNICIALALGYPRLILAGALAITLLAVALAPQLKVQSNPLNFFPPESRIARDFQTLNVRLTGMLPSHVVVKGGADPRPLLGAAAGMRKVIDITHWTGGEGRTFLCLADNDAVDSLARSAGAWHTWAAAHGSTLEWHGVAAQICRSGNSVRLIAAESLPSMAVLIAALVAILFRRIRIAIIGAWICVLPVAGLIVIAFAAHWRLGPVTLMIGSITAGIAVDDTLHLLTTSRRRRSVVRGAIECWKPCVGSSLAAASCFSLFTLSAFEPTSQFGILMALATCLAMLANQIVLPACMALSRFAELEPPGREL